jgi:hypothetical protein
MRIGTDFHRHVYLGYPLTLVRGQVDQLEDRYLGMVEASGSNPDLSIFVSFMEARIFDLAIDERVLFSVIDGPGS